MEYFLPILFGGLFYIGPILYLFFMIYFLSSKDKKIKIIGKIMLGIIITILVLIIVFFVTCAGIIFYFGVFK